MFDETVKELSPEALRFIEMATKIPTDLPAYAVAVNYLKQGPRTFEESHHKNVLSPEVMHPFEVLLKTMEGPEYSNSKMTLEEIDLHWKALRLQLIRGFEFAPTPEDKAKFRQALEMCIGQT